MKFGTDVYGTQRMNPYDFGYQTFSLAPPTGQNVHSQYALNHNSTKLTSAKYCRDIYGSWTVICLI